MAEEIGLNKHFKNERISSSQIYQEAWGGRASISCIEQSIEGLVSGWLGFANAFLVEALLMLGAIIGICLVAVLVKGVLIRTAL